MINYSLYIDMVKQEIIIEKSPDAIKHRIPFYIDQLAGIITQDTSIVTGKQIGRAHV